MKKHSSQLTAAACAAVAFTAAVGSAYNHSTVFVADDGITVGTKNGIVHVTPMNRDIFRVDALPGAIPSLPSDVPAFPRPGQGIAMTAENDDIHVSTFPDRVIINSPTTTLNIDRATGTVTFLDNNGNELLTQLRSAEPEDLNVRLATHGVNNFSGAGERGHSMRLNGDTLVMYNRQNYGYTDSDPRISQMGITVPYIASDRGFGVLFDDHYQAEMIVGDTITYKSQLAHTPSYYFINGDSTLSTTTSNYTLLTGRQPLPPFWTLGYITSKYGYHNEAETRGAIDSLKTRGYPVDGIVLDLYWYGVETDMGRLAWDTVQFPDHRKMLSDLHRQGVNTVLITQPYINKKGAIDNYNYLAGLNMLTRDSEGNPHDVTTWVGDAGMLDVSNAHTREWLWDRLSDMTAEGVAGWWGDLGEPEVHPQTIIHANGLTASQYHNVYGNEWSKLIFDGLRTDFPDMRPMLMMRGGTTGLQRYAVFPWTTDVSRSWGGFKPQIKLMLNSGLSGLGYMSSDLGGFAVDPENPIDPELYVRWLEMGTFTPMMRTHAQLKPEPYHYPQYQKQTLELVKTRYRWLPYNYTLAYENAAFGLPLARPLNFNGENPDDKFAAVSDEYLWGDNVLVAPVFNKGARSRKVLFPAGEWYNWYNPLKKYKGDTERTVEAPLGEIPLFVRSGSFIPQYMEPIENVTQYNPQLLTVRYFPDSEETSFSMYDDNRLSPTSLEDGTYCLLTFTGECNARELNISIEKEGGLYDGMPDTRLLTFEIPALTKIPREVTLSDGTEMPRCVSPKAIRQYGWAWNEKEHTLTIRIAWNHQPLSLTALF